MLYLQLQAETIEELRAQALAALDLRSIQHTTAAGAKVEELKNETSSTPEQDAAALDVKPTSLTGIASQFEAEVKKEVDAVEEKPAKKARAPRGSKKGNGKKPEPEKPVELTRDSVRAAFNKYVNEYGVGAAQTDGPVLLGRIFGNGIGRIGDVPEDSQEKLQRIVAAVDAAIFTNEFNRTSVKTVEAQ